jgi:UDP-N-acetylglucosamine 2-epimerase (non-hydrolysing)
MQILANSTPIYFIIGTRAQFIKVAPVMREMQLQNIPYTLIYTAQHRENIQEILRIFELPDPDFEMYIHDEANTRKAFMRWFLHIARESIFRAKKYIPLPGVVLTHGDTATTWLAAIMGRRAQCLVGHIESGFRSFNLLSPFPEELNRLLTFRLSDIYFCADEWAVHNLENYRGRKVNVGANTLLDAVRFALDKTATSFDFQKHPYGLVSIHRYENIFTSRLIKTILPLIESIAKYHRLVITLHPTTRERLHELKLYSQLKTNPNVVLHDRFGFVDWINICHDAEFVITDGGSNQEELSYLGVPTLLFRNETERKEGLDQNVVLSKFDHGLIHDFLANAKVYRKDLKTSDFSPSEVIVSVLAELIR